MGQKIFSKIWTFFRWVLTLFGAGFLCTLFALVCWYIYIFQRISISPANLPLGGVQDLSSPELLNVINNQTLDLEFVWTLGRAYRPTGTNLLITNYHAVKCFEIECEAFYAEMRTISEEKKSGRMFQNAKCIIWLDVCVFNDGFPSPAPSRPVFSAAKDDEKLFLALDRDDYVRARIKSKISSTLLKGTLLKNKDLMFAKLPVRRGYSGSPVFNASGEAIGIMRGIHIQESLSFTEDQILGLAQSNDRYFEASEIISGKAIDDLIVHPKYPEGMEQLKVEVDVFLDIMRTTVDHMAGKYGDVMTSSAQKTTEAFFQEFWDKVLLNPSLYNDENLLQIRQFPNEVPLRISDKRWLKLHALYLMMTKCPFTATRTCEEKIINLLFRISDFYDVKSEDHTFIMQLADIANGTSLGRKLELPKTARDYLRLGAFSEYTVSDERNFQHYNEAVRLDPQDGYTWISRAGANFSLKNYIGAVRDVTRGLELHPKLFSFDSAYKIRATSYGNLGLIKLCEEDKARTSLARFIDCTKRSDY